MKTLILMMAAAVAGNAAAAPLKSATVSKIVNDVRISEKSAAAQTATAGQRVTGSSTVLTGRDSRAELSFADQTVTRIGANSVFRFSSGSREMEIVQGSFLLNVPKNAGGAKIRTATVTAAITGTSTMTEFSPGQWFKFIVLEGLAKLTNRNGDTIDVHPGQMIVMRPNAGAFPRPVLINIEKLVRTSKLTDRRVFGALNGRAVMLIDESVASQLQRRRGGELLPTGVAIRGPGSRGGVRNSDGDSRIFLPPNKRTVANPGDNPPPPNGSPNPQ